LLGSFGRSKGLPFALASVASLPKLFLWKFIFLFTFLYIEETCRGSQSTHAVSFPEDFTAVAEDGASRAWLASQGQKRSLILYDNYDIPSKMNRFNS
jgi:hypothetical protein